MYLCLLFVLKSCWKSVQVFLFACVCVSQDRYKYIVDVRLAEPFTAMQKSLGRVREWTQDTQVAVCCSVQYWLIMRTLLMMSLNGSHDKCTVFLCIKLRCAPFRMLFSSPFNMTWLDLHVRIICYIMLCTLTIVTPHTTQETESPRGSQSLLEEMGLV